MHSTRRQWIWLVCGLSLLVLVVFTSCWLYWRYKVLPVEYARRMHVCMLKDPDYAEYAARVYLNWRGQALCYRLLEPPTVLPNQRYPLILYLHGMGAWGDDNRAQLFGIGRLFLNSQWRRRYPCFIMLPQSPQEIRWAHADNYYDNEHYTLSRTPSLPLHLTMAALNEMLHRSPIDPHRLYVVGYSMGGAGAWDIICRYPNRFAAAVPISGRADAGYASQLVDLPIWAFHGALDDNVPVIHTRRMIAAIRRCGGHPRYTEYPHVGHDCIHAVLANQTVWEWLFAQRSRR